jgi:hypothetical protein
MVLNPAGMCDFFYFVYNVPNFIVNVIIYFLSYFASLVDKDGHFMKISFVEKGE